MALAVLAGVGLRAYAWARDPSFWIDEAMLALNVVHRPIPELFTPLDLNQGAPVGYLVLSKLMQRAFGASEATFRAASLVAGLAGLALFARFTALALPAGAARLATALFAISPYLVGYSAEFKQYELDTAVAVALLLVARPAWSGEAGPWRHVGLAVAGSIAVWFSHPAAFTLGGIGAALAYQNHLAGGRRDWLTAGLVVTAWAASFGVCWAVFTRKLGKNAYLTDYWAGQFAPLPPTRPGDFAWLAHHLLELFEKPGGFASNDFGAGGLAATCWLVGFLSLRHADRKLLLAVTVPLGLALLASGLKKYPFAGRLMLFAVPALIVLVAQGASVLIERLRGVSRLMGPVVVGMLVVPCVAECWWQLKRPLHAEESREAFRELEARHRPGEPVYVYYGAVPAYAYYASDGAVPRGDVTLGAENRNGDHRRFHEELAPLLGSPRVWVVLAHRQVAEEAAIRSYLDAHGRRDETHRLVDAVLFRYDLSGPAPGR